MAVLAEPRRLPGLEFGSNRGPARDPVSSSLRGVGHGATLRMLARPARGASAEMVGRGEIFRAAGRLPAMAAGNPAMPALRPWPLDPGFRDARRNSRPAGGYGAPGA